MNLASKVSKCLSARCEGLSGLNGIHYCILPMHTARIRLVEVQGCLRWKEKVIDAPTGKWPARLGHTLFYSNGVAYGRLTKEGIKNGLE